MATSVVFDLVGALVTQLGAALSVNVHDGYGLTDDPGDYLMVGVEDPDGDRATSAEGRQDWAGTATPACLTPALMRRRSRPRSRITCAPTRTSVASCPACCGSATARGPSSSRSRPLTARA
jgi:hypothetical protein